MPLGGLSEEEQRRSAAEKRLVELQHGSSLRDLEAGAGRCRALSGRYGSPSRGLSGFLAHAGSERSGSKRCDRSDFRAMLYFDKKVGRRGRFERMVPWVGARNRMVSPSFGVSYTPSGVR